MTKLDLTYISSILTDNDISHSHFMESINIQEQGHVFITLTIISNSLLVSYKNIGADINQIPFPSDIHSLEHLLPPYLKNLIRIIKKLLEYRDIYLEIKHLVGSTSFVSLDGDLEVKTSLYLKPSIEVKFTFINDLIYLTLTHKGPTKTIKSHTFYCKDYINVAKLIKQFQNDYQD